MRQALHIFRKDVHHLWLEISLLCSLAAILGWAERYLPDAWAAEALWTLAANFAIARVIHAEAIPGLNQFWLTRPYRWQSLVGAKFLFIVLFVNLPLFAAHWYIASALGFSVAANLPGLILSNLLMGLCFSLPIACLAALTASLGQFLFSEFIVLALAFIGTSGMVRIYGVPLHLLLAPGGPVAVEWVRDFVSITVAAFVAIAVLGWQYKKRHTGIGRVCATAGVVFVASIYLLMPWSVAVAVQSRLSSPPPQNAGLRVTLEPVSRAVFPPSGSPDSNHVEVVLPIEVHGLPAKQEVAADALRITLQAANGEKWTSRIPNVSLHSGEHGTTVINAFFPINVSFFLRQNSRPVTMRGQIYLTVFGNTQTQTIPIGRKRVDVIDGLRCGTGLFRQLYCGSVIHWPRRRVSARFGTGDIEPFTPFVSYSPFPVSLSFNPFEQHWVSTPPGATEATIVTTEPLNHFRTAFEIQDIRLSEFTRAAQAR